MKKIKTPKKFIILKDISFLEDDSYCVGLSYWSARRGQVFIFSGMTKMPDEDNYGEGLVRFEPVFRLDLKESNSRNSFKLEDFECRIKNFSYILHRLVADKYIHILE